LFGELFFFSERSGQASLTEAPRNKRDRRLDHELFVCFFVFICFSPFRMKTKMKKKDEEVLRLVERQALLDPCHHRLVDLAVLAELALALGAFARSEMAKAWLAAHDLAGAGDFHPLGSGLFRLATCDGAGHGARKVAAASLLARGILQGRARYFRVADGENGHAGGDSGELIRLSNFANRAPATLFMPGMVQGRVLPP
jgi:hypothetical protein